MNETNLQKVAGANTVQKSTESGSLIPRKPVRSPLVHFFSLCLKAVERFNKGRNLNVSRQCKVVETLVETKTPDGTIIRRSTRQKDTRFSLGFEDD